MIGFVGVGRMGANMARRLKDRGFHVTAVYDTNRKAATDLAANSVARQRRICRKSQQNRT